MKNILTKTMKTLAVAGMTMGLALQAQADTKACTNCLTFSADKAFGIRMNKGKGSTKYPAAPTVNLEYSTDQVNWQTFNVDTDYAAGADHKFYLRGKNNETFASSYVDKSSANIFTNTADSAATAIACSGNVETLLDYTKVAAGEHPTMGSYAFFNLFLKFRALTTAPELPAMTLSERCYNCMFYECSSLTVAPVLPATTLADNCYNNMFFRCSSLTVAPDLPAMILSERCYYSMFGSCYALTVPPALPATTLAENCYGAMFQTCTSLTDLPDLPATTLTNLCYATMFMGCPALKVNTAQPGKAWSIPAEAATSAASANNWNFSMFKSTAGDITSTTVTPGSTYYIASAPVEFRVTEPEHATFQAYTNGVPVSVPFTGDYLTDFTVTYTAAEGKMFPGGYSTLTTNVTASAATVTITLTAEQHPIAAEACTNCITFAAEDDFGIKMWKQGSPTVNPSLEYSTNQIYWETFNTDDGAAAGPDHKLYLRGSGNTTFASDDEAYYGFTNTFESAATAIACSGNIETLLDYQTVAAGEHPEMAEYAFSYLFSGFSVLTTAPELPAMTLAKNCYNSMFNGCKSLTAAPELPATNLAARCYQIMFNGCTSLTAAPKLPAKEVTASCYSSMFKNCTSLTDLPDLPATNLAMLCYNSMFSGCTSLIVNTNAPGKAWSIPAEAAMSAASATYWNMNMFMRTSGDITNTTVTCGVTYYVASAPVTLDVAPVDNATFQAYTNDVPADVPCTIDYIMPVKVVYTATPGYAFPDGNTEFTTNVTASAATVTVTLTADQQPKPLPPVEIDVKAPEGATAAVYSNEVAAANLVPAGGTVVSNSIAYVVYTVSEEGKYFENGATAVTNTLDTTTNPATDKSAYVPTSVGTPKVQLGVVAQRYPWNGTLDIEYKTPYANASVIVTFYANGEKLGTAQGTGGQGVTASFDLNTAADGAFKDKALKNVKITATIEK